MEKYDKLKVKIGDNVTIKSTGGTYSSYTDFFDDAKRFLIFQMGKSAYHVAKDSYCKEVKREYAKNGHGVQTKEHGTYTVIGFAPHSGVDEDDEYNPEVLVLKGENGEIRLFSNFKRYFEIEK